MAPLPEGAAKLDELLQLLLIFDPLDHQLKSRSWQMSRMARISARSLGEFNMRWVKLSSTLM